jgi:hypothetical protein
MADTITKTMIGNMTEAITITIVTTKAALTANESCQQVLPTMVMEPPPWCCQSTAPAKPRS